MMRGAGAGTLRDAARPLTPETEDQRMSTATETLQRWICESCGYTYDPELGDPDGGIPPGTPFEGIPDTWICPVCGARKRDFVLDET
jgi:rubredoxin